MLFGKGKVEDPLVLIQQGKFKEAIKVLHYKLEKSPHDRSLKMRLAEALEGDGQKEAAAAVFVREAESSLSGGDRGGALAFLKKAQRLTPGDGDLSARIAKLDGQPEAAGDQAFSFDIGGQETPEGDGAPEEAQREFGASAEQPAPPAVLPEETGFAMAEVGAGSEQVAAEQEAQAIEAPAVSREAQTVASPADEARLFLGRLFQGLDAAQLNLLAAAASPRALVAGEVLLREEEPGDALFIVLRGRLEARGRFEERELKLAEFGPGDVLGEVAFLNKVPRTATVTAMEAASVLELPGDVVRGRFAEYPEMQVLLDSILNQRVERTLDLVKQSGQERNGRP